MDKNILGITAVVITWLAVVYLIVACCIFWTATQRDWNELSLRVVGRNAISALSWGAEIFRARRQ